MQKLARDAGEGIGRITPSPLEELSDIFYTNQKRGHVFRVKLNSRGFTLQRETSGVRKEQLVALTDIVGARCMRLQKPVRRLTAACTCTASPTKSVSGGASIGKDFGGGNGAAGDCDSGDASAYLYVFAYVLKKNLRSTLRRERQVLTLRFRSFDSFDENIREAERWYRTLRCHKQNSLEEIYNLQGSPSLRSHQRRLLVLLNPKSGSGKARDLFHHQVVPVLNEAELAYDLHVTKHAQYARDFVRLRGLSHWSGIVAIGGDGIFFEVLNGLLQRTDWEQALDRLALGIVPCGSGNGLARSIAHARQEPYDPKPILSAALTVVSGRSAPMDVVRVELENQVLYSFLSVGWGLISDIDIESERLRTLGYQRFTIWTLHRLICLRTYRGKIAYLPKVDVNDLGLPQDALPLRQSRSCHTYLNKPAQALPTHFRSSEHIGEISSLNEFADVISLETSFRSRCDSWFSAGSRRSTYYSLTDSVYHSVCSEESDDSECDGSTTSSKTLQEEITYLCNGPSATVPPLHAPLPPSWVTEEGDYVMVHAAYQTHLGIDCFFAPSARLNDGTIYLVIIRGGISRSQLLHFLINMSSGTHLPDVSKQNEFVKVVPVTAFRIQPLDADEGIITVDGERVPFGALQGEILPGIARVMVPK